MIKRTLIRGLKVTIPLLLTLLLLIWVFQTIEAIFRGLIEPWFPYYFPGLGALSGLVLIFSVGLLINAWVVRTIWQWTESWIERIPLVKTIYITLQDCMKLFDSNKGNFGTPVVIEVDGIKFIGFITAEKLSNLPVAKDEIAVYFPMSYQIGGYTTILPRSRVTPLEWSTQETMKFVLSAGVVSGTASPSKP